MTGRTLTQAELLAEATARFGKNPLDWAFTCPQCGDVATGRDFREALQTSPRVENGKPVNASSLLGQECIGRTLGALGPFDGKYTGRGCDWAAYGLFAGPWTVVMPGGRQVHSFPLAGGTGGAEVVS